MQFSEASDTDRRIFAEWSRFRPLEERTCYPVQNGKRILPSKDVLQFSFMMDEIDELVGQFSCFNFNIRNRSAEFGYAVNPQFRQRGIGTKMLTIAISHLFLSTNLNKLYCQTAAFNIASIRLIEKIGFHRDAVLREHHELNGNLYDDRVYSVLRQEWKRIET